MGQDSPINYQSKHSQSLSSEVCWGSIFLKLSVGGRQAQKILGVAREVEVNPAGWIEDTGIFERKKRDYDGNIGGSGRWE